MHIIYNGNSFHNGKVFSNIFLMSQIHLLVGTHSGADREFVGPSDNTTT